MEIPVDYLFKLIGQQTVNINIMQDTINHLQEEKKKDEDDKDK